MNVNCGNRNGLYLARSGHSRYYKDRIWSFGCKRVSCYNFNHCYWTGYLNFYDAPLLAQCRVNYIMTGMYSVYHNHYGDRMFQLLCCRAPRFYTRNCHLSGYVNGYRGFMNWGVGGNYVFNGALSIHNNHHEWVKYMSEMILYYYIICIPFLYTLYYIGTECGDLHTVNIGAKAAGLVSDNKNKVQVVNTIVTSYILL